MHAHTGDRLTGCTPEAHPLLPGVLPCAASLANRKRPATLAPCVHVGGRGPEDSPCLRSASHRPPVPPWGPTQSPSWEPLSTSGTGLESEPGSGLCTAPLPPCAPGLASPCMGLR